MKERHHMNGTKHSKGTLLLYTCFVILSSCFWPTEPQRPTLGFLNLVGGMLMYSMSWSHNEIVVFKRHHWRHQIPSHQCTVHYCISEHLNMSVGLFGWSDRHEVCAPTVMPSAWLWLVTLDGTSPITQHQLVWCLCSHHVSQRAALCRSNQGRHAVSAR